MFGTIVAVLRENVSARESMQAKVGTYTEKRAEKVEKAKAKKIARYKGAA